MELFQPTHLLVLAILAGILFFGWKQMPDMARSLGRSLRVFKTEIKGLTDDDKQRDEAKAQPQAIEAPRVEIVKNEVVKDLPPAPAASRPRPAPRPTADDTSEHPTSGAR